MRDCNRKRGFECPNICIVTLTCDWHLGFSRNDRNLEQLYIGMTWLCYR